MQYRDIRLSRARNRAEGRYAGAGGYENGRTRRRLKGKIAMRTRELKPDARGDRAQLGGQHTLCHVANTQSQVIFFRRRNHRVVPFDSAVTQAYPLTWLKRK